MATLQYPNHLLYQRSDEWLLVEGDQGTIGVSDYAQDALNDVVFVELPEVGDVLKKGAVFGTVESVKAAADLKMPIDGEVIAVNSDLESTPETINAQPYGAGWIIKIKITGAVEELLNADEYRIFCESR